MITRGNIAALALIAAALAPPTARAAWFGQVGLNYGQLDDRGPGLANRVPRYGLDLGLGANGSIGGPGVFDWMGDASYVAARESQNGEMRLSSDTLQYKLWGSLLNHSESPLTLSFGANRVDNKFQTGPDRDSLVHSLSTGFQASLALHARDAPAFGASYARTDLVNWVPGLPEANRRVQSLQLNTSQPTGPLSFAAQYSGTFSDGTYVPEQYDDHTVFAGASGFLGPVNLNLNNSWWKRAPHAQGPGAYSSELDSFAANAAWTPEIGYQGSQYHYARSVTTSDAFSGETLANSLGHTGEWRLGLQNWFLKTSETVSHNRIRRDTATATGIDDATDDSTSESVSAEWGWRRAAADRTYELRAGPAFGFLQTTSGNNIGWGLSGAALASRIWGANQLSASYSAGYGNNIPSTGSSLTQSLAGGLARPLGLASLNASIAASTVRTSSPIVGTMGSRSVQANAGLTFPRYTVTGYAAVVSTSSAAISPGSSAGDGLLVPLPFDQHYISLRLATTVRLRDALTGNADIGRWIARAPGLPSMDFTDMGVGLSYSIGTLSMSVTDRLTLYPGDHLQNLFMATLTRTFGSAPGR
jgi:hypothetical protein